MKLTQAVAALGSISALCSAAALALPVSLSPAADAFVTSAAPASNFGAAGALSLAAGGLPRGEVQTLLKFDAAPAVAAFDAAFGASHWIVTAVELELVAAVPNNPLFSPSTAGSIGASWMSDDSWAEGTGTPQLPTTTGVTFASLPGFLSGADVSLGTAAFNGATSGTFAFSFLTPVQLRGDIASGGMVSLRLFGADAAVAGTFNSRNFGTPGARPRLVVHAELPEPAAIVLLATPLPLVWLRRRR